MSEIEGFIYIILSVIVSVNVSVIVNGLSNR